MNYVENSTPFWRQHADNLYRDIRKLQAEKLLPIQNLLAERNYEGVEGSLISADRIHDPESDSNIFLEKRLNYTLLFNQ